MGKFKVGDIVKIKEDLIEDTYYNHVCFSQEMSKFKGKIAKIEHILLEGVYSLNSGDYGWSDDMLELYEFKKDDIQFGDIITLGNSERYVYAADRIFAEFEHTQRLDYRIFSRTFNRNFEIILLDYKDDRNCDIIKIERQGQIIYERKEEEVEMTLSEVCEKLGYNVKIVKERGEK